MTTPILNIKVPISQLSDGQKIREERENDLFYTVPSIEIKYVDEFISEHREWEVMVMFKYVLILFPPHFSEFLAVKLHSTFLNG